LQRDARLKSSSPVRTLSRVTKSPARTLTEQSAIRREKRFKRILKEAQDERRKTILRIAMKKPANHHMYAAS
jgi:hypothetical protein